jgi:putative Mn2+ efflux pump MntP
MLKAALLIVPLGIDTFILAAALGAAGLPAQRRVRVSLLLSAFESGMPLVGLALGAAVGHLVSGVAGYVAIALLLGFGGYMLLAADDDDEAKAAALSRTRGPAAIALALTVSLDELAIGFTLGLLALPVVPVLATIAVQAFVLAQLGLRLGGRVGEGVREGAERVAGLVLVALAAWLVLEKLGV